MTPADEVLRRRNDALRAELIAASRRTEHLVESSEEFFQKRERLRKRLARVAVSAEIEPGLGVVKVTGDGRIAIELEDAKVARSDTSRLGERILTALAKAERKVAELHERVFSPPAGL
jgi:DNA-binding protein YbaB